MEIMQGYSFIKDIKIKEVIEPFFHMEFIFQKSKYHEGTKKVLSCITMLSELYTS